MIRQIRPASTLDNLKKEAKRWLKALRAGDEPARARLERSHPQAPAEPGLRDVQYALAREHGLPGWAALVTEVGNRADTRRDTVDVIQPEELGSEQPYGPWSSRGCDVWDAIRAARSGDVTALRRLLARDAKLSRYGEPLHFAVREGHAEAVQVLLDAGADADALGPDGESLATVARDRGHEEVALIIEDAVRRSVRVRSAGTASADHPIHLAADANDVAALGEILDAEPHLVELGDRKGGTPLHRAVLASAHDAIGVLLDRGANIQARHGAGPGDAAGYAAADFQPIDLALFWHGRGDVATARLLALARRRPRCDGFGRARRPRSRDERSSRRIPAGSASSGPAANGRSRRPSSSGTTRSRRSCWSAARIPAGRRGLKRRVDPRSTLRRARAIARWSSSCSIMAPIRAPTSMLPATRRRRRRRGSCARCSWREAACSIATTSSGWTKTTKSCGESRPIRALRTPAAVGCSLPPRRSASAISSCGCCRPERACLPSSPRAARTCSRTSEILRLLLAGGMDPDLPNWQRATLLHALCGRDARGRPLEHRVECAAILLDAGADISARDEEYRSTPLAWAARNDLPEMVELLLARGAPTQPRRR